MSAPAESAPPADRPSHWLYGRWIDLLVGCCGIYALSIPVLLALSASGSVGSWPAGLVLLLGLTINAPHYGATLVRLYERREDRRKYLFFTLHITLVLVLLFVMGTRSLWLASAIITAYVLWSPWHFSAQNYGLALMFMGRGGVALDPTSKRLFYLSFVFATAMAIGGIQAASSNLVFAPGTFHAADMPRVFVWPPFQAYGSHFLVAVGAGYLATLAATYVRMAGSGMARLGPVAILVVSQALFSVIPVSLAHFVDGIEINLAFAPFWISMAHSAQYLWVSAYFARRTGAQQTSARFLLKSFLAGSGVTILPTVLFAPAFLGDRPYDAGLAGLVFAMVNLHHFIMDGAIWKLRDGGVGKVLLRSSSEEGPAAIEPPKRPWLTRLVYAACLLSILVPAVNYYETSVGIPNARKPERIDTAFERLRLLGRESIGLHLYAGREYLKLGQPALALRHFERSLELHPTPDAHTSVGNAHRNLGDREAALAAYDAALGLDPDYIGALLSRARASALDVQSPTREQIERARSDIDRALRARPDHPAALALSKRLLEVETRL